MNQKSISLQKKNVQNSKSRVSVEGVINKPKFSSFLEMGKAYLKASRKTITATSGTKAHKATSRQSKSKTFK